MKNTDINAIPNSIRACYSPAELQTITNVARDGLRIVLTRKLSDEQTRCDVWKFRNTGWMARIGENVVCAAPGTC
jgi:hypothetical protein